MTHCVGVLVVSELHQCGAAFPLPGFGGALTVTTLASVRLHAAVLPHAARAAATAWWDVFLVTASCDGGGSVIREKKEGMEEMRDLPLISLSLLHPLGLSLSAWHWTKCFWKADDEVNPSFTYAFFLRLMSCLVSMLILFTLYLLSTLLLISSPVFGLMHSSNPYVTDLSGFTKSPSTRISCFQQWLQLLWLCCVSADKVTTHQETLQCLLLPKHRLEVIALQWGDGL